MDNILEIELTFTFRQTHLGKAYPAYPTHPSYELISLLFFYNNGFGIR